MSQTIPRISTDPRAERTRRRALAAAAQLLLNEGWDSVTHVRLAAATGMSRMTMYRHWPSRTDILRDVISEAAETRRHVATGDVRHDLRVEMHVMRTELFGPPQAKMLAMLLQRAQADPDVAAIRDQAFPKACNGVTSVLQAGVAAGIFPARLNIKGALAQLVGPCIYERLAVGEPLSAKFVDDVVDMFLCPFAAPS